MKFNIHGSKIKVTEAINNYIEEKIGKLDKYFEDANDVTATVVIRLNGKNQVVEVTIPIKKIILRAEESHNDLYAAIDLVSEKLERQIRKNKTRLHKSDKDNINKIILDFEVDKDEEEHNKIVKRKVIDVKPMNEEEAILQMNLLGHDFFVFIDDTNTTNVLYKRKDGNYGLIETK